MESTPEVPPAPPEIAASFVHSPAITSVTPVSRGLGVMGAVLISAIVATIVGLVAGVGGYTIGRTADEGTVSTSASSLASTGATDTRPAPAPGSVTDIAARSLPGVVSILAEGTSQSGSGSGFVIRPDGYLLTNNHVVDLVAKGGKLTVTFSDGVSAKGTVVGTSPDYDLAVIKVNRTSLPTLPLGDSSKVRVGDSAIAIGAPLGLDGTVTAGIVSALDRPVTAGEGGGSSGAPTSFINAIQTDAAINPGNSGGPLLDARGSVIGVDSAIATLGATGGSESGSIGLGFAIPINSAKRVADQLIATGKATTPILGVKLDMGYTSGGARVQSLTPGSAAAQAGLQPGDIITALDGRQIHDGTELVVAVRSHSPGDRVIVTFTRDGKTMKTTLMLGDNSTA
ncbi:MAG: trypsin-like peptidase domain-containing protein [Actinomycetes bacterium]|jgi:putative serine protease PepD